MPGKTKNNYPYKYDHLCFCQISPIPMGEIFIMDYSKTPLNYSKI